MSIKDLKKRLSTEQVQVTQIGSEIEIAIGMNSIIEVEKRAKRALSRGKIVTWDGGCVQWQEIIPTVDLKESGSAQFQWKNDQVQCMVILHTKSGTDETKEHIGERWVNFEKVWE